MIRTAEKMFPEAIFAVHLDHGDEETCYDCIDSGFYSSVMIDASHESFDENIAITKRVVDRAHAKGISVEAELGRLGGVEEDIKVDEGHASLHESRRSGANSLSKPAVIRSRPRSGPATAPTSLRASKACISTSSKKSRNGFPGTPIVMHGSSSVPIEEVERINAAGGKLDPSARGVNENEYLPAAKLGVTKVNIDTDGRLVWTRVHREFFRDHPDQFDFRPPGKIFVEEYAKFIAHKNEKLGSAGTLGAVRAGL